MTSLPLLVADLRHAELCVLGCKFVLRPSFDSCLPEASSGASRYLHVLRTRIPPTVAITKMTR